MSKTCLVRFHHDKDPVEASAVGRPVEVHAYADRIDLSRGPHAIEIAWGGGRDGRIVGRHARAFGRGETVYNPLHYGPVLARKPGALRNGAPFEHWVLPRAIEKVRVELRGAEDGDRQMVDILGAVLTDGLAVVEAACAEAVAEGVHSADVVLDILAPTPRDQDRVGAPECRRDPEPPVTIMTPEALPLRCVPRADGARYDSLGTAV